MRKKPGEAINVNNGKFVVYDDGGFFAAGYKFKVNKDGVAEATDFKAGDVSLKNLGSTVSDIDASAVQYDTGSDKNVVTFEGENGTALKNVSDIELKGKSFAAAGVVAGTSKAEYDVALGEGSWSEGESAVALGHEAYVTGWGSMAMGAHTWVTGNNSVALGFGSIANEDNVVSVGGAGVTRRVVNVADGIADSDAATVGQLKDAFTDAGIDPTKGNVVQYDENGELHAGNEGTGKLDLDKENGSASLTSGNGAHTSSLTMKSTTVSSQRINRKRRSEYYGQRRQRDKRRYGCGSFDNQRPNRRWRRTDRIECLD